MKLKSKVVGLSLLTLLLPWSGWKLLQELEGYLRETQEASLLASARVVASALPLEFQTRLLFTPDLYVRQRDLQDSAPRTERLPSACWPAAMPSGCTCCSTCVMTAPASRPGRVRLPPQTSWSC
jgi:hypothetical protein